MLVGRTHEREALDHALGRLAGGDAGLVIAIEGEPGIGKSRLLAELAQRADGCLVLGAAASEFEDDLPYAVWAEALEPHLRRLDERRLARLGIEDAVLPARGDRHAIHRALRDLLGALAGPRPLVLMLDDLHWADPASLDAIAALVRRPPDGAILLALAAREGRLPALARDERVTRLALTALSEAEAAELVGGDVSGIYHQSGGNPFYLEQLARSRGNVGGASAPEAVTLAIAAELAELDSDARRMLDAAAVVGDPFDPALAAEVAELPAAGLPALDDLLARTLVRATGTRRFAFRHPVVRHAVYESAPGGWRLAAHARAAAALERRGAGVVARAHHVEHAAEPGDTGAAAVLAEAARELQGPAPASAARFYAAAQRLAPDRATQIALAEAQSACGDATAARATLLDALEHERDPGERRALTVRVANTEFWLGHNEEALQRLHVALRDLPAEPSADRIRLHLSVGLTVMLACDYDEARAQSRDALADALALGDPVVEAAALGLDAFAQAAGTPGPGAAAALERATEAYGRLAGADLMRRLPGLWMLAWGEYALGRFETALGLLREAHAMASSTGRELVLIGVSQAMVKPLIELGRVAEAIAAGEEALDRARLSGNAQNLIGAQCALSAARLASGDVSGALREAEEAAAIDAPPGFHRAAQPGWCLGAALTAAGNAERGAATLLAAFADVVPAERPAAAADLVEAQLATGDVAGARATLEHVEAPTPWAAATIARARVAVTHEIERAYGAPLADALLLLANGRALATAGDREAARAALTEAEAALDGFGAVRRRDEAVRELRKLGHRVLRPARDATDGPLGPLTAREREIALLVADGRTNREVAEQLVLSAKTIEAHLRNIYAKLGVRSRVELTRRVSVR